MPNRPGERYPRHRVNLVSALSQEENYSLPPSAIISRGSVTVRKQGAGYAASTLLHRRKRLSAGRLRCRVQLGRRARTAGQVRGPTLAWLRAAKNSAFHLSLAGR